MGFLRRAGRNDFSGCGDGARTKHWPRNSPSGLPTLKGHFRIHAAWDAARNRTFLARQSVTAPWHLSKPHQDGGALTVQVVNSTAGILEGDELELSVEAGPDAQLVVTTPSASRAFTMRAGSAGCRQEFTAADGACLDLCPEPLFPHAGCRYRQETHVHLAPGASAFLLELVAPGRAARGEAWAWERLEMLTEVRRDGRLILAERLGASGPELGALAAAHGFAGEAWFATAVIVAPALAADPSPLEKLRALHRPDAGVWAGVSRLPDPGGASWIFKAVAARSPLLRETVKQARQALAPALPPLGLAARRV